MTEALSDIEVLALSCRSEQSRTYISEALKCYRAGAYRAAIVTTWIALVFDLIDKIRDLTLSGDAAAKLLDDRHEQYINQIEQGNSQGIKAALEFEREILDTCRNHLQFFDIQQFDDLNRLREDRHRCAHPSFQRIGVPYNPSAEQARLHLRNSIVHVLSQPPIQGKSALAELQTMVSSSYFPKDNTKALLQLESSSIASATEALVRGFVDLLIFGYFSKGDVLFGKEQVFSALNAVLHLRPAEVELRIRKQLNKSLRDIPDDLFESAAHLLGRVDQAWDVLEQASRDKIVNFVENGPTNEVLSSLLSLSSLSELAPTIQAKFNTLDLEDLATAIGSPGLGALAKERALHFLSEAGSWDSANSLFNRLIFPIFDLLTQEDITRIIRMPRETGADLRGSHGFGLFVSRLRETEEFPEVDLNDLLREIGANYLLPQSEQVDH